MAPSQSPAAVLWLLIPISFVGLFAGIWGFVCFIISRMGWRSFSSRYGMETRPPGQAYASPLSRFGSAFGTYRNVVRVVLTDTGVYFYVMFLFRLFNPPFLVPWASVRRVEKKDDFFGHGFYLKIEDTAGEIHVLLPTNAEYDLFRYYKAS